MSKAVDVAPPATPLPSTKVATAKMVGHRLPNTYADSPKMGMKMVLDINNQRGTYLLKAATYTLNTLKPRGFPHRCWRQ